MGHACEMRGEQCAEAERVLGGFQVEPNISAEG